LVKQVQKQSEPNVKPRKRKLLKTLLFIFLPLLLLLFFGEALLRLSGFKGYQLDPTVYRNVPGDMTPRQDFIHYNPHTGVSCHIRINKQGFRGKGLLDKDRPCTILCLGDSSMMGYGVDEGYSAPDLLREWIDMDYPGIFEVINAASIGYTIDDELDFLREKGPRIDPDVVLLEIFYNDVTEKEWRTRSGWGTQREFRRARMPYTPLRSLMIRSALFQALRNGLIELLLKSGKYFPPNRTDMMDVAMYPSKHPQPWQSYDSVLRDFIDFLEKRKIPLLVAVTPHQYQLHSWGHPIASYEGERQYQDHFLELLREKGVPAVDLMPVYQSSMKEIPSLYLTGGMYDEHPSSAGQYIKAREMYSRLTEILEKKGFYNFYRHFDEATTTGKAHTGRLWVSRGDAPSLVLEQGSTALFRDIPLGAHPVLRFYAVMPWYSKGGDPSLRILVRDMKTAEEMETFSRVFKESKKEKTSVFEIPLVPFAGRSISVKWSVEAGDDGASVCIMAPIIMECGKEMSE